MLLCAPMLTATAVAEQGVEFVRPFADSVLRWAIFAPLLGAFVNAFFGAALQRKFGRRAVHAVALAAMAASCVFAELAFFHLLARPPSERFLRDQVFTMWQSGALRVDFALLLDPLSGVLLLVVTHIGALIHLYSTGYMDEEPCSGRYFAWLNFFIVSMLTLVLGSSLPILFIGWEGVGLCSWALIGFWYAENKNGYAGFKAFVVNRMGDAGLVLGLGLLFWTLGGGWGPSGNVPDLRAMGELRGSLASTPATSAEGVRLGSTLELSEIRNQVFDASTGVRDRLVNTTLWGLPVVAVLCLFLLLGAIGKSAQIPLFVWLPDAMAGPTPVSALIHAATMVTAGVYLIARLGFLFVLSPIALTAVATVGALTALLGAVIALAQTDIKKVLAYSTVSQLGFMFVGVGTGAFHAGIFHLVTHALFKACLFLAAGSVIYAAHHQQDLRKLGGLAKVMPITRYSYLAATIAIAGLPVASGFFSKDEILARTFAAQGFTVSWLGPVLWAALALAAFGTSFYMFRSYWLAFGGVSRADAPAHEGHAAVEAHDVHAPHDAKDAKDAHAAHGIHESPWMMTSVLAILAFGAVIAGFILCLPEVWTHTPPLLETFLEPSLPSYAAARHLSVTTEVVLQGSSVALALAGLLIARAIYADGSLARAEALRAHITRLADLSLGALGIDAFYQRAFVQPLLTVSRMFSWIDQHVIDGLVRLVGFTSRAIATVDDAFDRVVVDGAVHGVGNALLAGGEVIRRTQSGRLQTYLTGATVGAIALVILQYVLR